MDTAGLVALTGLWGLLILVGIWVVTRAKQGLESESPASSSTPSDAAPAPEKDEVKGPTKKKSAAVGAKVQFSHPWLVGTLKGHGGHVLDMAFSENGKFLASCAYDRGVILWTVKDFEAKEHKTIRCNIAYDHGAKIDWSPDSRAFIVQKPIENRAEVYKLGKKEDGSVGNISPCVTFPATHETDVIGLGFSSTGKFVMTCSDQTTLLIWSIQGQVLATLDTYHMSTYCAKVSPCGRFVASSGFTPDVKVWEVKFKRSGEFEKVTRAFELTGHSSGVFSFDFSADSSRMATVSKDGSWKVFKTNVEFERGQDPSAIASFPLDYEPNEHTQLALSPDGHVVALSQVYNIHLFSALSGDKMGRIDDAHQSPITCVLFDKEGRWMVTSGDRHIRVFRNVPGLKTQRQEAELKLSTANTAGMKDRLTAQLQEIDQLLAAVK